MANIAGERRSLTCPHIESIAGLLPAANAYANAATREERTRRADEARASLASGASRHTPEHMREAALAVAMDARGNEHGARTAAYRANGLACTKALESIAGVWPSARTIADARAGRARSLALQASEVIVDDGDREAGVAERAQWRETATCAGANDGAGALSAAARANAHACERARAMAAETLAKHDENYTDDPSLAPAARLMQAMNGARKTTNAAVRCAYEALESVAVGHGGVALRAARLSRAPV